jgi:small-conductance mechanosensitive channel
VSPSSTGSTANALQGFFVELTSAPVLTEIIAITVTLVLALAGYQALRPFRERQRRTSDAAGWQAQVLEGAILVTPVLAALVLLLVARAVLAAATGHTAVVDAALQLAMALLLVRIGVYGLRMLLGGETWFDAWENRIAFTAWVIIGFALLGWLDRVQGTLEKINLVPGRNVFTLWELLKGVVIVTIFVFVTTLAARTIERRLMRIEAIAVGTRIGISKFTYFFLVALGILLGINAAGVDVTTLNVLTGAIGLGLGIGLQTIAANFVSGFVLLMDKSIKPGDVISFTGHSGTSTENFGWVQELRGRYVVVRDRDGVETLVPNQNLITNQVINWSYSDERVRIRLPVVISYDDDPELALSVLLEAVRDHPRILREPQPVTRLMAFEDHGMRLEVRFWIADPMNGVNNVRSDVNRAIWRVFREHGIKIPVAQREIRMLDAPVPRQLRALMAEPDEEPD